METTTLEKKKKTTSSPNLNDSTVSRRKARCILTKWHAKSVSGEKLDKYLCSLSKKFMKYKLNVFLIHRVS